MKIILFCLNSIVVTALSDSNSHVMFANRFTAWARGRGFCYRFYHFLQKTSQEGARKLTFSTTESEKPSRLAFKCIQLISTLCFLDLVSDEPRLLRYACKTTGFKILTCFPNHQLILGSYWWLAQQQDLLLSTCPKLYQAVVDLGISVQQSPFQGQ